MANGIAQIAEALANEAERVKTNGWNRGLNTKILNGLINLSSWVGDDGVETCREACFKVGEMTYFKFSYCFAGSKKSKEDVQSVDCATFTRHVYVEDLIKKTAFITTKTSTSEHYYYEDSTYSPDDSVLCYEGDPVTDCAFAEMRRVMVGYWDTLEEVWNIKPNDITSLAELLTSNKNDR